MPNEKYPNERLFAPLGGSTSGRLRRMGLLTAEGRPDRDALAVVSRLYAGQFYEDLCDFYSDADSANIVCLELEEHIGSEDPRLPFLYICSAYDAMCRALPDPIWWMAGDLELVEQFSHSFIRRLSEFARGSEVM